MTRVLVTGATGFIGCRAVRHLAEAGFEVHCIGRDGGREGKLAGVRLHQADLFDAARVEAVVQDVRPTHLMHLAWYAEPGTFWRSAENLKWVGSSLSLLRVFAEAGGRRAVFAGTCAEYAWTRGGRLSETETPCEPETLYGVSKDSLRRIVQSYSETVGVSAAWGRVFFLYGPNEKPGRLISGAFESLMAGRPFDTSPGIHRRDFLHVDDAARAFSLLCASHVVGPVNIGSGSAWAIRDILAEIGRQLDGKALLRFGARSLPANEPDVIEADTSRLALTGFVPRFSLPDGIADTVAWWKANSDPA